MTFHQDILSILLEYRQQQPEFNFICRQRNRGEKFEKGFYFQGNEHYAFVGIIDRSGGINMTRSAGLAFFPNSDGLRFNFEIVHKGEKDQLLLDFYKELRTVFKEGEETENNEKFIVSGGIITKNNPEQLFQFLDTYFPKIKAVCRNSKIENLLISNEKFDNIIKNVLAYSNKSNNDLDDNPVNAINLKEEFAQWLLENAPESYSYYLGNSIASVVQRLNEIEAYFPNQSFFEVNPQKVDEFIREVQFTFSKKERNKYPDFIDYDNHHSNGIPKAIMGKKNYVRFLNEKLGEDEKPFDFEKALSFFNEEEILFYFEFLDEIVQQFNLQIGDERLVFTCGSKYLNLNIGQRFIWRLKPQNQNDYWIISNSKLDDSYIPFDGPVRHFYTTFNEHSALDEIKPFTFGAIEEELRRTSKSGFRNHNNTEFEKAVFDKEFRAKFLKTKPMSAPSIPLNQILYGPPGTGKTYYLKDNLFEKYISEETSISAEQHFESVVSSCSWWQVIAIALLDKESAKVSEIFEHEWIQKKVELSNSKTVRATIWGQLQSHTIDECEFVNVSNRRPPLIFNKTEDSHWEILEERVEDLVPELYELKDSVENYNPNPDNIVKHYEFVTFHQSFSYEDFIEGIKPLLPETDEEQGADLGYQIKDGIFKNICLKAEKDPDNRYAIFIDEINRGNVSAIFGELITLIESDKRKGAKNELTTTLPYSKDEFGVPQNLDIYGTMNTADRSVEALDTALRRRFSFKEMMPNPIKLGDFEVESINLSELLDVINARVEALYDRDHTIGHSYFYKVKESDDPKEKLIEVFKDNIIPLLQEYFFGDYTKIGLILGEQFIETNDQNGEELFAKFDAEVEYSLDKKHSLIPLEEIDIKKIRSIINNA
ncbi:hypothetical protein BTO09_06470 [Gilvibacter sp. SZ-19]|uniref:McrB family protein n=1 Tax=Gilvibacter sp. SZ-19 TaxID=754429 RepID=UPI000B3CD9DD|nr:AAA family ATPase [Gilvibacter sp. SZ-19]ARV12011.1 hypothetical protein BTO09_06470 [Gilvibacter sp. SZ-19]